MSATVHMSFKIIPGITPELADGSEITNSSNAWSWDFLLIGVMKVQQFKAESNPRFMIWPAHKELNGLFHAVQLYGHNSL